jgi:hypothetical protein
VSDQDRHDDDDGPVTPEERARAASLARLVDAMLDGREAPPALEAEDRSLLEVATAIHAGLGVETLGADRKRRLVESALAEGSRAKKDPTPIAPRRPPTVKPEPAPKQGRRVLSAAPWVVAALASAAAILLLVRTSATPAVHHAPTHTPRSPDAIVGKLEPGDVEGATARIDSIYADRFAAYRARGVR